MYERIYADLLAKIQNGDYQTGRPAAIGERVSRALWGKPYYSEKGDGYAGKGKKDQQRAGRGSFVCSPAAAVEMKKESRGTANQRSVYIRWVWKRFWHTAFAGD